jgi:hypothetical protein
MSKKVRPLTIQMVNELQVVLGAMELGDYEASLKAVERTHGISDQLRAEIVAVIEERHQDELAAIARTSAKARDSRNGRK